MKKLHLLIILITSLALAQTDSIPDWLKSEPEIKIISEKISINSFLIEEKTGNNLPIFFFEPGKYTLPDNPVLHNIAIALKRNPDVHLSLKGFYSRTYDDILSPALLMELAGQRADAIRQGILATSSSLVNRIDHQEGYDMSELFLADTSEYDLRSSVDFYLPKFSSRSVLIQDFAPYIRSSFRDIIKIILPELDSLMSRNPDLHIQIYARGHPWDVPLWECYRRLERIGDYLGKKLGPSASNRISYYVDDGKPTKSIDIRLHFTALGTTIDKWERSPASDVSFEPNLDFQIKWNEEMPIKDFSIAVISQLTGQNRLFVPGANFIENYSESTFIALDTIKIAPEIMHSAVLPGDHAALFRLVDIRKSVDIGSTKMKIKFHQDSFDIVMDFDAVFFEPFTAEPLFPKNVNLYRISKIISNFAKFSKKSMKITIIENPDSTNLQAEYVSQQLLAMLIPQLDFDDDAEMLKWFEKNDIQFLIQNAENSTVEPVGKPIAKPVGKDEIPEPKLLDRTKLPLLRILMEVTGGE